MTKVKTYVKGFTLNENLKNRIDVEINRIDKMLPDDAVVNITFVKDKNRMKCDVVSSLGGAFIKGEYKTGLLPYDDDTYEDIITLTAEDCVDKAVDDLKRKARKLKTKLIDKKRNPNIDKMTLNMVEKADVSEPEDFETLLAAQPIKENSSNSVKRTKDVTPEVMLTDEAIVQMEMLGHDFFIYRNIDDVLSIVYKRKNKTGYGLLKVKED